MSRISIDDIRAFKLNVSIVHYELDNVGQYDLRGSGLCYALSNADGSCYAHGYAIMSELFTELASVAHVEPRGEWGPHRLGLICLLNAMSVDELYEIANSEAHTLCQA